MGGLLRGVQDLRRQVRAQALKGFGILAEVVAASAPVAESFAGELRIRDKPAGSPSCALSFFASSAIRLHFSSFASSAIRLHFSSSRFSSAVSMVSGFLKRDENFPGM